MRDDLGTHLGNEVMILMSLRYILYHIRYDDFGTSSLPMHPTILPSFQPQLFGHFCLDRYWEMDTFIPILVHISWIGSLVIGSGMGSRLIGLRCACVWRKNGLTVSDGI